MINKYWTIMIPMIRMLLFLIQQPWMGRSWVVSRNHNLGSRTSSSSSSRLILSAVGGGPFFGPEEEFECPDEEECEIDWDNMPGFGDDDEEDVDAGLAVNEGEEEPDDDDELVVEEEEEELSSAINADSFASQFMESMMEMENSKVRLEMRWQIDECEVDEDRCDDFCEDCAGSGLQYCRFCRGTGVTTLGDEFRPCLICSGRESPIPVGMEKCEKCRGNGRISKWAATLDKYMDVKKKSI